MNFKGRTDHLSLGKSLFDPVEPVMCENIRVRYFNQDAAFSVGLLGLSAAQIEHHFGRFEPLPGSLQKPLALRYHGHQFQVYNPNLGDGRGFLFAQCIELRGTSRLLDFGTKGTGITPYSRSGDGRLTLKGAVRELLATSMLESQGVPTSRTFAIVEDLDTELYRGDEPSPARSAMLTRLSHSHIRIGTFQRLAFEKRADLMEHLVRYVLTHYYRIDDQRLGIIEAVQILLREIVRRKALTLAGWMMAGFVHGVLNTDNINITGESFDYGPWRWLPTYDGKFTAAYFDNNGLYAYGRQPRAVSWNLTALASALSILHTNTVPLQTILSEFGDLLQAASISQFFWRTRLHSSGDFATDTKLAEALLSELREEQLPFEDLFYYFSTDQREHLSQRMRSLSEGWSGYPVEHKSETMLLTEVEDLWQEIAARDNWDPLNDKIRRLREIYEKRCAWEAPSVKNMEEQQL